MEVPFIQTFKRKTKYSFQNQRIKQHLVELYKLHGICKRAGHNATIY